VAALIRDAVDAMYVEQRTAEDDITALRRGFGAWQRDVDPVGWRGLTA